MQIGLRVLGFTAFLGFCILLPACSDDSNPESPSGIPVPTLDNVWPNEDGNFWEYELTNETRSWTDFTLYENAEDVPPIPPLQTLYEELGNIPEGPVFETIAGTLHMKFNGEITNDVGVTAQRKTMVIDPGGSGLWAPHLLGTEIWQKQAVRIVGFSLYTAVPTWIYLESNLSSGHQFQCDIAPGLADATMTGRVWRRCRIEINGTSLKNCLECFYLVDLGVQMATNESGELIGYLRDYWYGVVVYAPEIGPVYCHERCQLFGNPVLQDQPAGILDIKATLVDYGASTVGD